MLTYPHVLGIYFLYTMTLMCGQEVTNSSRSSKVIWVGKQDYGSNNGHRFGDKPLPDSMLNYSSLDPWRQITVKFESKYNHVDTRNRFDYVVCKLAAILSQPPCGNETTSMTAMPVVSESGKQGGRGSHFSFAAFLITLHAVMPICHL